MISIRPRDKILKEVTASAGSKRISLGQKHVCRFCQGAIPSRRFKKIAHTFPQALGNKWIISLDECDDCNALFSVYESALAEAVGPFLTLSGARGADGKIRQTGRSKGISVLRRCQNADVSGSLVLIDKSAEFPALNSTGSLQCVTKISPTPFTPCYAYKALCKMAFAILPEDKVYQYENLRTWLQIRDADAGSHTCTVGLSLGLIYNSLPFVSGVLVERINLVSNSPYILFIFTAGTVSLQIALISDHQNRSSEPMSEGMRYEIVVGGEEGQTPIRVSYSDPVAFNWSSMHKQAQPVDTLTLETDPITGVGSLSLRFRM